MGLHQAQQTRRYLCCALNYPIYIVGEFIQHKPHHSSPDRARANCVHIPYNESDAFCVALLQTIWARCAHLYRTHRVLDGRDMTRFNDGSCSGHTQSTSKGNADEAKQLLYLRIYLAWECFKCSMDRSFGGCILYTCLMGVEVFSAPKHIMGIMVRNRLCVYYILIRRQRRCDECVCILLTCACHCTIIVVCIHLNVA